MIAALPIIQTVLLAAIGLYLLIGTIGSIVIYFDSQKDFHWYDWYLITFFWALGVYRLLKEVKT